MGSQPSSSLCCWHLIQTSGPTSFPTGGPTAGPTVVPTGPPTSAPTEFATGTDAPTNSPTAGPTLAPTFIETPGGPTAAPTSQPTTFECQPGQVDEIPYKADLSFEVDYRAKVPADADPQNDAATTCGFKRGGYNAVPKKETKGPNKGKFTWSITSMKIEVESYMDRCQSWVRDTHKKDADLLKHEQVHFDICEYWARKTKADYDQLLRTNKLLGVGDTLDAGFDDLQNQVEAVFDANFRGMEKMQDDYDNGVKNAAGEVVPKEQDKWNRKVARLLGGARRKLVGGGSGSFFWDK